MTRRRPVSAWLAVAALSLACCQNSTTAEPPSDAAITELFGSGRLQLTSASSRAFVSFWNDGRTGFFATSVNSGHHAYRFCKNDICTISQARMVIDECNDAYPVGRRTCALLASGNDIVWRGEVLDPYRGQAVLDNHNRRFAQALTFEFPGGSEQAVATVFIDRSRPIGLFTMETVGFGGFCQGTYDFSSAADGLWDLRCLDGYEASGTFRADDLARGGSGVGADSKDGVVRLTLMPRG